MSIARCARVLLTSACLLLALPALASAAYTVDTVSDEPDAVAGGACNTAANKCSLRAAIEVTNLAGIADEILFNGTLFNGQLVDTIVLGSELEPIEAAVTINAGTCPTAAGVNGPCAGVNPSSFATAFVVQSDGVTIRNLAISDAFGGIQVEASEFIAGGNWLGLKLDGLPVGGEEALAGSYGIRIEPKTEKAQIGGTAAVDRNVIGGFTTAIRIRGAKENTVQGNYVGVGPDGTTARPNERALVIADSAVVDMKTVELQKEDVPYDMTCHTDSEGNVYDFAFGLNWSGIIKDNRTEKYKR